MTEPWVRSLAVVIVLAAGCGSTVLVPGQDPGPAVHALLTRGDYHAAMRLLPAAMAEYEREARRRGHSVAVISGSLGVHTLYFIAEKGDAHWGSILDDPDISYPYKTGLLFNIIEARLGKGAVYVGDADHYVVPTSGPVDLDEHWKRLRTSPGSEPARSTDAAVSGDGGDDGRE